MIERPPRSSAELSPRLRTIAEHAVDQFEEPKEWPTVRPSTFLKVGLSLLVILVAIVGRYGLYLQEASIINAERSASVLRAAQLRAMARACEEDAREHRAFAATGKSGPIKSGGFLMSPRLALRRASTLDQNAESYRKQAYLEERLNLKLQAP